MIDDFGNYEELDKELENQLNQSIKELKDLKIERTEIGNPKKLTESISQIVWEQFILQIAGTAGQDFIRENNNLNLSLSKGDHYLNPDSFTEGKLPTHNADNVDKYANRYNQWNKNFTDSSHEQLSSEYRDAYDANRPKGSASMAKDHTIPVAEIVRDKKVATYMSEEEKVAFANDTNINLKDLDSSANQSKSDRSMKEWLDSTNKDGKHPDERFNINKKELVERDEKARNELNKQVEEKEAVAKAEGRASVKQEAVRSLGYASQAVAIALLAKLTRTIFSELIVWFLEKKKNTKSLIEHLKKAVLDFLLDFKNNVLLSIDVAVTVILTQIFGEIIPMIRKALLFLQIGGKTVYQVGKYLADPVNRAKDTSTIMLEVGRIAVVGLSSAGAIALGFAITSALCKYVPPLGLIQIPLLGSPASLLGIFFGGITVGIVGAIVLHQIDGALGGQLISENIRKQNVKGKEVLQLQAAQFNLYDDMIDETRKNTASNIKDNHEKAKDEMQRMKDSMDEERKTECEDDINNLKDLLDSTEW